MKVLPRRAGTRPAILDTRTESGVYSDNGLASAWERRGASVRSIAPRVRSVNARPSAARTKFDTFLSHAHADKAVVDRVHAWLVRAGPEVWYDATHLSPGAEIAAELGNAIPLCRTAIVVLSRASVESGWVEDEWSLASLERNRKTSGAPPDPSHRGLCGAALPGGHQMGGSVGRMDDLTAWAELLDALVGENVDLEVQRALELYVMQLGAGREQALVELVLPRLRAPDVRLIGDSPNWPDFNGNRVKTLMRSCGGVVCIIPNRVRSADKDELKHFISEARTAVNLGLPLLVVAESGADLPPDIPVSLRLDGSGQPPSADAAAELDEDVQALLERCRQRPRAGQIFLAVEFEDALRQRNELLRRMIQRSTGLPCAVGEQIGGDTVQRAIIQLVRQAVWVLADVTGNPLNTCIEAGAALGADVECTLLARQPYVRPPFMLRGPELKLYENDIDLLAIAHREARLHRRRVITTGTD